MVTATHAVLADRSRPHVVLRQAGQCVRGSNRAVRVSVRDVALEVLADGDQLLQQLADPGAGGVVSVNAGPAEAEQGPVEKCRVGPVEAVDGPPLPARHRAHGRGRGRWRPSPPPTPGTVGGVPHRRVRVARRRSARHGWRRGRARRSPRRTRRAGPGRRARRTWPGRPVPGGQDGAFTVRGDLVRGGDGQGGGAGGHRGLLSRVREVAVDLIPAVVRRVGAGGG